MHDTRGQALYIDLGPGQRPLIALLTRIRRAEEVAPNYDEYRWLEDFPVPGARKICLGEPETSTGSKWRLVQRALSRTPADHAC